MSKKTPMKTALGRIVRDYGDGCRIEPPFTKAALQKALSPLFKAMKRQAQTEPSRRCEPIELRITNWRGKKLRGISGYKFSCDVRMDYCYPCKNTTKCDCMQTDGKPGEIMTFDVIDIVTGIDCGGSKGVCCLVGGRATAPAH